MIEDRVKRESDDTLPLFQGLVKYQDILCEHSVNMYKEEELICLFTTLPILIFLEFDTYSMFTL